MTSDTSSVAPPAPPASPATTKITDRRHEPARSTLATTIVWLLGTGFLTGALLRFYRRFIFGDGDARIWATSDDVYISACFGRSLFNGDGLVWYPGAPKVEGFSNPLWTLIVGGFHRLPGFTEARLGIFIIVANALLLSGVVLLFWTTASQVSREADCRARQAAVIALSLMMMTTASLAYWSAEGFEVALVAFLALAMIHCASHARSTRDAVVVGVLFILGLATRMDFALAALPGMLLLASSGRDGVRRAATALGVTLVIAVGLLLLRHAYYGDWLPNTYYLKATHWPWRHRIARGVQQNTALITTALAVWTPLLVPAVRRVLGARLTGIAAAWMAFTLSVSYSVYVGGDSWNLYAGYDRHTVVGGLLLAWGLFVFATSFAKRGRWLQLGALAWALLVAAWPLVASAKSLEQLRSGLWASASPKRNLERGWIEYGKAFEAVSLPGARIALCPAGAIVYFSHRGGVDLLGKVDPHVARAQVSTRDHQNALCWQNAPGHNKGDDLAVFQLRQPEFSKYKPPGGERERFVRVQGAGSIFYVRKDSPLARWDQLHRPKRKHRR